MQAAGWMERNLPKVLNIRYDKDLVTSNAVWCDRRSQYGNPFKIGYWWHEKKKQMTRDDVCDRFKDEILPSLDVSALKGKDLICWCKPARCHCDDIIKKANS